MRPRSGQWDVMQYGKMTDLTVCPVKQHLQSIIALLYLLSVS